MKFWWNRKASKNHRSQVFGRVPAPHAAGLTHANLDQPALAWPGHAGAGVGGVNGAVGGAHAGYKVYPCRDGRVAFAALEPHFAAALLKAAGLPMPDLRAPFAPATHAAIAAWALGKTRRELGVLGRAHDIPLYTLAPAKAG